LAGAEVILLDTHALVWVDTDARKLGRQARLLIERAWARAELAISAVTFWEAALLHDKRRLRLPEPAAQWRKKLLDAGYLELALDGEMSIRAVDLTGLPVDPADRFIAATALCHGAALMTADEELLGWNHTLVRHDARR
jgi:PIN domain nuclease of toxin-antitoxin system